jgi:hypothetical protein
MFVAVNCAEDIDSEQAPSWLPAAKDLAQDHGGLREAICWRNAKLARGGSNTLPILMGPLPEGTHPGQDVYGYGWHKKSKTYACFAARLHVDRACGASSRF